MVGDNMKTQKEQVRTIETNKGYQAYHSLQWWTDHLKNSDEIVLSYEDSMGDRHVEKLLFFDDIRHIDIPGTEPVDYICFQKNRSMLGNKPLMVPVLPANVIKIFTIRGEEFRPGKRFKIDGSVPTHSGSVHNTEKKNTRTKGTEPGFEIREKSGRFACPCGNDFGTRSHAVYHHKEHLKRRVA